MNSESIKLISTLYGEAFEIGVNAGIAETQRGYMIKQLNDWEEFFDLDDEEKNQYKELALKYTKYYNKIVNEELNKGFESFLEIYLNVIQHERRVKFGEDDIRKALSEVDKRNIVALLRLGHEVGRELLEWSNGDFLLQPKVAKLYPDFIIIEGESIKAVGDFKTYMGFFERDLTSVVWQLNFDFYNREELLHRINHLPIWNYKGLFSVLMKYMKVLRYATLIDVFPIKAVAAFPQGYSALTLENYEALREWENIILTIAEKATPLGIGKKERVLLLEHLKSTRGYITHREDGYYLVDDSKKVEIRLKHHKAFRETRFWKVDVDFKFTDIERIRNEHAEKFKELLNRDYDVVINASDQGIGKNWTLSNHIKMLHSYNEKLKVLFVAPRKRILIELEKNLRKALGDSIKISKTFSDWEVELEKVDTFYEVPRFDEDSKSATRKLLEALNDETNVILATSQAFSYFVHSGTPKILAKADFVIFDEFINSGAPAIEAILGFLRQFSKRKKNSKLKKVIITDASLTCAKLVKKAFEEHISKEGEVYTPLMTYISPKGEIQGEIVESFKVGTLNFAYYRRLLDFPLNFYALGFYFEGYLPDWERLLRDLSTLLWKHGKVNLWEHLKQNKVIFYIDNKVYVEDLAKYLSEKGYKTVAIHSGTVDKLIDLDANVAGTSTLAFGSNLENHEILIVLPPYKGHNYEDRAYKVELFRQVIKRMRGKEKQLKHVVFVGFANQENGQSIEFHRAKNFIANVLTNRKFHVLLPMHSGDVLFTIFAGMPREKTKIPLERFLRDYMPKLKRILYASGFSVHETFTVSFGEEKTIELPIPYVVYRLDKWRLAKQFGVEVEVTGKGERAKEEFFRVLDDDSFNDELLTLYQLVKGRSEKEVSKAKEFFKDEFNGLNTYQIAHYLTERLTPKYILATYSSILLVSSMYPVYSPDWKDLRLVESPLYKVFLGDSKYIEIPVIVKDGPFEAPGVLIHHPAIETPATREGKTFEEKIRFILRKERLKENTLFLPNLWRML
ncbi:hypothetical protein EP1X_06575 [Thermococcus sp. EP1]|uniref:DEAD/DEAH box helicase family protein n=1 Tax=Thermococcus sp. EP1 TaxID=1591054 RepID=UPI0006D9813C|nr:DEAD/DEAH box helicase family protein [Thermococcus sp. EP1]KPU63016.1 hypothetical protein EP1X_06575 [Thermococcus sp. EP1]